MMVTVWVTDLISIDFYNIVEKIYQTLKVLFDHITKHLEVHQKYSTTHSISNSFLSA